jgi:alanine racemase
MRLIRAQISSSALRGNLRAIRARAPHSRVMAVVKANAYGHGLVSTALALAEANAFAVARIDEAIALRAAGLSQPIVLLEGVFNAEQLSEAAHLQLELVVHEASQLALLAQYHGSYRFSLWLKVDTGMNRLGFRTAEFAKAWETLRGLQPAPLSLRVMTHLASADERDRSSAEEQLARFRPLVDRLGSELSVANSAALLRLPETHLDWVRPGLALYGVSPFAGQSGRELGLQPAMTLMTTVIALRQVERGERVGYGGAWQAQRSSRLAILAAGYGDGLLRSLPNGAPVLVNGQRAPLAGRVSMDMIAVDVTDLPPVRVGDAAELWGERLPVEEVAAAAQTIPYELLCAVSQRVPLELT